MHLRRATGDDAALHSVRLLKDATKEADEQIKDTQYKAKYNYQVDLARLGDTCNSAIKSIDAELNIIVRRIANVEEDFARAFASWTGGRPANPTPRAIPEDIAKAHRYRLGGAAAAVLEIALATLVLTGMGVGLIAALISSIALTVLLLLLAHSAIAIATDRPSPPHSRDLIKKYVFRPALALTIPAIVIVLFARVVSDLPSWLLTFFLPLLNLSMWIATLGLILLGAALYALADLHRWSSRHARNLDQLCRWQAHLENRRAHYHAAIPRRQELAGEPSDGHTPNSPRSPSANSIARRMMMTSLLALSWFIAGCDGTTGDKGAGVEVGPAQDRTPAALHIEIDVSGSVARQAGENVAHNLHRQLPQLIEATGAALCTVSHFAEDGWTVPTVLTVALPRREQPNVDALRKKAGEARIFSGVESSVEKANQLVVESAKQQAEEKHQAALNKALAEISPTTLNPAVETSAACTDLHGVLSRIVSVRRKPRQVYVIVTDGYHTCGQMQQVPAPQGDVEVLVLLTPAQAKDGEGKPPAQQFITRREALLKIAPWLVIVPASERNLSDHILKQEIDNPLQLDRPGHRKPSRKFSTLTEVVQ
jgi:hypothetical protein